MEVSPTNKKLPDLAVRNMYVSNRSRKLKPLNLSITTSKVIKAEEKTTVEVKQDQEVSKNEPEVPQNEEIIEEAA
jgi:hypothetical protein